MPPYGRHLRFIFFLALMMSTAVKADERVAIKATSTWRLRKACCVPHVVIFEIGFFLFLIEICLLAVYFQVPSVERETYLSDTTLKILLITIGTLLAIGFVANIYTLSHLLSALIFSQRRHLQRTIARLETLKSEGFLQALKVEVTLMTDMVKCLDSFTKQQTRLVIIVNGLDSCEQDKVLMVLDAIHMLFSDVNSPFIVILAIDPHIISKAVELNSRKLISETNIGGHEYLRNMVHLPFFLANSALRKVKIAQSTATKKSNNASFEAGDDLALSFSNRRLSGESNFTSSMEKLKVPSRKSSRKLKPSDSIASSIGSNLNKIGGAQDLTKMLLTDDYFSDVNPRSMRRLLNVVYVTGRLLKAFQMDFNWYHLAVWINITEQWPYRTSWLIWFYEMNEDSLDDQLSLKSIYDEVRPKIPINKEVEPLLERDRDEKKFDIFLSYHRSSLLLSDLKIFLPFTINLDPYIKKVIKEDTQEERWTGNSPYLLRYQSTRAQKPQWVRPNEWTTPKGDTRIARITNFNSPSVNACQPLLCQACLPGTTLPCQPPLSATSSLPPELLETRLSQRTVDGVCELINKLQDIDEQSAARYISVIKENNINGKVLLHCDMDELKKVLQMNFGDWEMFKVMVISLREHELSYVTQAEEAAGKNVRFFISKDKRLLSDKKRDSTKPQDQEKDSRRSSAKSSAVENQVTLEDQMICGALQTLNEEACEDVLEESGDVAFGEDDNGGNKNNKDTSIVFLQSSPLNQPYWQATTMNMGEDSSPASSACGTPILQRRLLRSNSHQGSVKIKESLKSSFSRSRIPTDLKPDEHLKIDKYTPPSSPKNFGGEGEIFRSKSTHLFNFTSLKKKKSSEVYKDTPPNLVITPASSTEKINKLKEKFSLKPLSNSREIFVNLESPGRGNFSQENDENAPLVIEIGAPLRNSDSQSNLLFKSKKLEFDKSDGNAEDISQSSLQSSPEVVAIPDKIFNKQMLLEPESSAVHFLRQSKSSDNLYCDKYNSSKPLDLTMNFRTQRKRKTAVLEKDNPDTPV